MKPTVTLARKAREGSVTPDDPRVPVSMTVNGGVKGWPHFEFGIEPGDGVNLLWPEVIGSIRGRYFILTGAQEQGGSHDQECPLCRDWVRRNVLDSLGRRPVFGDGPFASRDIHDVSAL